MGCAQSQLDARVIIPVFKKKQDDVGSHTVLAQCHGEKTQNTDSFVIQL